MASFKAENCKLVGTKISGGDDAPNFEPYDKNMQALYMVFPFPNRFFSYLFPAYSLYLYTYLHLLKNPKH